MLDIFSDSSPTGRPMTSSESPYSHSASETTFLSHLDSPDSSHSPEFRSSYQSLPASSSQIVPAPFPWIFGWAVVDFDLELGQKVNVLLPADPSAPSLEQEELSDLAFLSFPDNTGSGGHAQSSINDIDMVYIHRLRLSPASVKRGCMRDENGFITGYVFFRQQRDDALKRGYLQRSLVLLSPHPFFSLFVKVVRHVAPFFFDHGPDVLVAANSALSLWPSPFFQASLSLAVLGSIFTFPVPEKLSSEQDSDAAPVFPLAASQYHSTLLASYDPLLLYDRLHAHLKHLWTLWEIVLLGEPLLVISPSPEEASLTVLSVASLISPLSYSGDFRPYFTIYDSDFSVYTAENHSEFALPPVILGVTNPFFLKALAHWPNVLTTSSHGELRRRFQTKHKTHCVAESVSLQNKLRKLTFSASKRSPNDIIRKYTLRLTQKFLHPLKKYFSTLLPFAKSIHTFSLPPRVRVFNHEDFLNSIKITKYSITGSRSSEEKLYRRFLSSANFTDWLRLQTGNADKRLGVLYRQTLYEPINVSQTHGRKEEEIIFLYQRLLLEQQRLDSLQRIPPDVLLLNKSLIFSSLPKRIQAELQESGERSDQIEHLKKTLTNSKQGGQFIHSARPRIGSFTQVLAPKPPESPAFEPHQLESEHISKK